jgi:uncharacterized protein (TIGR00725 family)
MTRPEPPPYVAVVGPAASTPAEDALATDAGAELGRRGAIVLCGGGAGVMAAAARGVRSVGGTSIGLLPGADRADGDPALTIALPTGLGELRNGLLVRAADAVLAVGGSWGTLSEVALAVRTGRPVVILGGWTIRDGAGAEPDGLLHAEDPEVAVAALLAAVAGR